MVVQILICGFRGEQKVINLCDTKEQIKSITGRQLKEKIIQQTDFSVWELGARLLRALLSPEAPCSVISHGLRGRLKYPVPAGLLNIHSKPPSSLSKQSARKLSVPPAAWSFPCSQSASSHLVLPSAQEQEGSLFLDPPTPLLNLY
ncbi:uncharacterized protein LOC123980141 isoform X3 [Micropterus dolomieu]|uniref:uncharacterized protein LOC123980141 isoform X3 n=1 Tax=Micropterus dolomieu TaxID=147949 RepID=UPI001E8CA4BA|nr:uncharacterized protein LOC123980141 isoform X3 [Micropterus dolomieu]